MYGDVLVYNLSVLTVIVRSVAYSIQHTMPIQSFASNGGCDFIYLQVCVFAQHCFILSFSLFSDGITGTSLGARMLQGGVKKGLLLRNMQVE